MKEQNEHIDEQNDYIGDGVYTPPYMVDDTDLKGIYTWEDAIAQIELLNSLCYKGFNNWRIPTKTELNQLYKDKENIGGFTSACYWSSANTKPNKYNAWIQYFENGAVHNHGLKDFNAKVRIVRDLYNTLPDEADYWDGDDSHNE